MHTTYILRTTILQCSSLDERMSHELSANLDPWLRDCCAQGQAQNRAIDLDEVALVILPPHQWHRMHSSAPSPARPLAKARQANSSQQQQQRRAKTEDLGNVNGNVNGNGNDSSGSYTHSGNGNGNGSNNGGVVSPVNGRTLEVTTGFPSPSEAKRHSGRSGRRIFSASSQGQMVRESSPSPVKESGFKESAAPSRSSALRFRTDSAHSPAGVAGAAAHSVGSQGSPSPQPLHERYVHTPRACYCVQTRRQKRYHMYIYRALRAHGVKGRW